MERQYQIQGKRVSREVFFDHLTTGDWNFANLFKRTLPKLVHLYDDGTTPISPEKAKEIMEFHKKRKSTNNLDLENQ